jgi:hypothetical protein
MGSMTSRESDGKSRGTMATASWVKSTRPHDASADHSTSHGDRPRSRWIPVASLVIVAASSSTSSAPGPQGPSGPAARARRSSRAPENASISATETGGGGTNTGGDATCERGSGLVGFFFTKVCSRFLNYRFIYLNYLNV